MTEHRPHPSAVGLGHGLRGGHVLLGEFLLLRLHMLPRHLVIVD